MTRKSKYETKEMRIYEKEEKYEKDGKGMKRRDKEKDVGKQKE